MPVFDLVHEVAVLGTTLLMMGVATLWYSPYLFQSVWMNACGITESDIEKKGLTIWKPMLVTFVGYYVSLFIIALGVTYMASLGISILQFSLILTLFFAGLMGAFTAWDVRPLSYYLVTISFAAVFIIGGAHIIALWPW